MSTWQLFDIFPPSPYGPQVLRLGRNSDGRLEVFAVGDDSTLWHDWQTSPNSSSWSGWSRLGNPALQGTDLVVGQNADGRLEVFVIGLDNSIFHAWQSASGPYGGWSDWVRLGNPANKATQLAVAQNADGRLELFSIGLTNVLFSNINSCTWHIWQVSPNGVWSDWAQLGTPSDKARNLAVARNADGRLEAFSIGLDFKIYHTWQTSAGGGWSTWSQLGNPTGLGGGLAIGQNADGRLEVFLVGTDQAQWHAWQNPSGPYGGWSDWVPLAIPDTYGVYPVAALNTDGTLEFFLVSQGPQNLPYHIRQISPNGGWSSWQVLVQYAMLGWIAAVGQNADGRLEVFARGAGIYHTAQLSPSTWPPTPPPPTPPSSPPPPQVKVPAVIGLLLSDAVNKISSAGLMVGTVVGGSGATNSLKVIGQNPSAGQSVPKNTAINLGVTPVSQSQGVKQLNLYNCDTDGRSVNIWLYDGNSGNWSQEGQLAAQYDSSGSCPVGNPLTLTFASGHAYKVVAVDVGNINCGQNDPSNVSCQRWSTQVVGDSNGSILRATIT